MHVIFNADDFGRSSQINRAVLQAHREGVLTSASLMVTSEAVEEAVEMARATPTLAVGLHLVLSGGWPASVPAQIPHLVRGRDRFPANPAAVWIQYITSGATRAEIRRELRAQFERFVTTGLPLDHVDGHQHIHMHPAVFHALLPLARQYRASGVRLPRDDFSLAMRYDRRGAVLKAVWAAIFGILCRRYVGELDGAARSSGSAAARRLAAVDRVYGVMQSGRMEEAYVVRVIDHVQTPATPSGSRLQAVELYFHPSLAPQVEPLGPNPGDLAALLSPAVRQAIEARGWVRASYATLNEAR